MEGDSVSTGVVGSKFLMRSREGLSVVSCGIPDSQIGTEGTADISWKPSGGTCTVEAKIITDTPSAAWSPEGSRIAAIQGSSVTIYKHPTWQRADSQGPELTVDDLEVTHAVAPPHCSARTVRFIQWSPQGTYLVAFYNSETRTGEANATENLTGNNLFVYDTVNGNTICAQMFIRRLAAGQWPLLKWREDEKFCCIASGRDICVYRSISDPCLLKVPCERRVLNIEVSPATVETLSKSGEEAEQGYDVLTVSAFSPDPGAGEEDARFRLVRLVVTNEGTTLPLSVTAGEKERGAKITDNGIAYEIVVDQIVASADSSEIMWSPSGMAVLVMSNTIVDAAGKNYGGTGDLWFASANGDKVQKVNTKVAHEARWSPVRDEFILIEGKSPADIYLYDKLCRRMFAFPSAYRNTVRWCPFGSMVAIGGFGNLAGDVGFWYRDAETHSMKLIANLRDSCTVQVEWSTCGRLLMTASTFPRMKVENLCKIFTLEGYQIQQVPSDQLYDVQWRAEDRSLIFSPPSPKPRQVAEKRAPYVPKSGSANSLLARFMRGEIDESELPDEMRKKREDDRKRRERREKEAKNPDKANKKKNESIFENWRKSGKTAETKQLADQQANLTAERQSNEAVKREDRVTDTSQGHQPGKEQDCHPSKEDKIETPASPPPTTLSSEGREALNAPPVESDATNEVTEAKIEPSKDDEILDLNSVSLNTATHVMRGIPQRTSPGPNNTSSNKLSMECPTNVDHPKMRLSVSPSNECASYEKEGVPAPQDSVEILVGPPQEVSVSNLSASDESASLPMGDTVVPIMRNTPSSPGSDQGEPGLTGSQEPSQDKKPFTLDVTAHPCQKEETPREKNSPSDKTEEVDDLSLFQSDVKNPKSDMSPKKTADHISPRPMPQERAPSVSEEENLASLLRQILPQRARVSITPSWESVQHNTIADALEASPTDSVYAKAQEPRAFRSCETLSSSHLYAANEDRMNQSDEQQVKEARLFELFRQIINKQQHVDPRFRDADSATRQKYVANAVLSAAKRIAGKRAAERQQQPMLQHRNTAPIRHQAFSQPQQQTQAEQLSLQRSQSLNGFYNKEEETNAWASPHPTRQISDASPSDRQPDKIFFAVLDALRGANKQHVSSSTERGEIPVCTNKAVGSRSNTIESSPSYNQEAGSSHHNLQSLFRPSADAGSFSNSAGLRDGVGHDLGHSNVSRNHINLQTRHCENTTAQCNQQLLHTLQHLRGSPQTNLHATRQPHAQLNSTIHSNHLLQQLQTQPQSGQAYKQGQQMPNPQRRQQPTFQASAQRQGSGNGHQSSSDAPLAREYNNLMASPNLQQYNSNQMEPCYSQHQTVNFYRQQDTRRTPEYKVLNDLNEQAHSRHQSWNYSNSFGQQVYRQDSPDDSILSRGAVHNIGSTRGSAAADYETSNRISGKLDKPNSTEALNVERKCWQYIDPKGIVQGPFRMSDMRAWNDLGYFEPTLPVRCNLEDNFVSIHKMYPPPMHPFSERPKRSSQSLFHHHSDNIYRAE